MDKPTIVLASNNTYKINELKQSLDKRVHFLTLSDVGFHCNTAETASTLEGNALLKAQAVSSFCHSTTISDDTGLFVKALDGLPGVHSARYAGDSATAKDNIQKLLTCMENVTDRRAAFRTVFCLVHNSRHHFFKGEVEGTITVKAKGQNGFGYDPIFLPKGNQQTFGEMTMDQKNLCSHRARAIHGLHHYLSNHGLP